MHRVSQWVENRAVPFRNCGIKLDDIRRGNFYELRESSVLIDAYNFYVRADMRFAHAALVAVSAVYVHFRADEITGRDARHIRADFLHHAAEFVARRDRRMQARS